MNRGSALLPQVVFVLGAPGSGKGTQCANIVRDYGFVHLSAGDLLREERRRPGSIYADMIENKIRNGQIVPVEVTCALIENAMAAIKDRRFLIDGFPRNADNHSGWERSMADKVRLLFVLQLECEREECMRRCIARGAAGSGRSDDNAESLAKRFDTYVTDTLPIVNFYEGVNLLKRVNADADPAKVYDSIREILAEAEIEPVSNSH